MKLAIVVGHSIDKKGAWAVAPLSKSEYEYNLEIAEFIYRKAMSLGMFCKIFLRNKIGLEGVYKEVNSWSDDNTACIELHFNSFNGKVRGSETLFDSDPTDSIELAREVHNMVCDTFRRKGKDDRGLKLLVNPDERGYSNLKLCKSPSCLIEPFFGDNTEDADMGMKLKMQYADAIVAGVYKFFKQREKNLSLN